MRPSARLVLVCVLTACVQDAGLNAKKNEVDEGDPDISVDPISLDVTGVCGTSEQTVTLTNDGLGILNIDDIELDGAGWTMDAVDLPLDIPAGESRELTLHASDGVATLTISSDDPDEGAYVMDLKAEGNHPPIVSIDSPTPSDVLGEGTDVELAGTVEDDLDIPPDITVAWSSDIDGVLTTGNPSPDGTTTYTWSGAARTPGHQTITLTATDTCGGVGTATVDVCQTGIVSYDALGLDGWHFEGSALYDDQNGWLQLTDTEMNLVGTAFETSEIVDASLVSIDFYVYMGDGADGGADGISLTALDTTRMDTFVGGTGCGIGYGGGASCTAGPALPGWSIEIDTFQNQAVDLSSADHLSMTFDGDLVNWVDYVELPEMESNGWHHVVVDVEAPHVTVAIDDVVYMDADYDGFYDFPAYVGFTAGTGQKTNNHFIDALQVTDDACN